MVDSPHGKGVTFTTRSAPVGYAAEYLTCGSLVAIPMGFSLHMFMRVLYHIWQLLGYLLRLLRSQIGKEVHLQGAGELRRRAEGYVDVLVKHLRDVRTRHLHALRKLRLRHSQLLHPQKNSPKKDRPYVIYRSTHCSIVRII